MLEEVALKKKRLNVGPRNDPLGLMKRSLINYRIIKESFEICKQGHVVTQLVQSLLALIIFPKERAIFDRFQAWRLDELNKKWPLLRPVQDDEGDTTTLYRLLKHMRNALSHGLVTFYGEGADGADTRYVTEILVVFQDRNGDQSPINWELRLTGHAIEQLIDCITHIVFD
jgi:hypothetical protein